MLKGVGNMRTYTQEEKQAIIDRVISVELSASILADTDISVLSAVPVLNSVITWVCIYLQMEKAVFSSTNSKPCKTALGQQKSPTKSGFLRGTSFSYPFDGGGEGNRTPVRKQVGGNLSGRSLLFTFPFPGGNKHPTGIGSFMMRGMGKAYHTHGLH